MSTRTTILDDAASETSGSGEQPLSLLVVGPDVFEVVPLPSTGTVTIGRADDCDIRVDDPLVSRQHARLRVQAGLAIEDLGSANGTRVRNRNVPPGVTQPVFAGETVQVGSTVLVVQRSHFPAGVRRLVSHAQFEQVVRQRCKTADRDGPFALLRLHVLTPVPWPRLLPVLARELASGDVLAAYGRDDYEYLLADGDEGAVRRFQEALAGALGRADVGARMGSAVFPRDGRTADALLGHANDALRPRAADRARRRDDAAASPAMRSLWSMATKAAGSAINVLILGETGVGKEVMAQAIHSRSPRAGRPLVSLNCAGLSPTLIESELFGHERGAFTGASAPKPGLLETAQGGSVFLDEVGELPAALQVKLLRVIEAREVLPVGGLKPRPIDVRFIAATNRDLDAEVERGQFRSDLYFRLAGIVLAIPPLRERRTEIAPLAQEFVIETARAHGRDTPRTLSPRALAFLESYAWPGNIRELKNVIERAVVLCDGATIDTEHLPLERLTGAVTPSSLPAHETAAKSDDDKQTERQRILDALAACAGNQSRAARMLGIPRRTFVHKLDVYGIPRPQKGGPGAR